MKPELEALKKQYQERSEKNQCVMCGEPLIDGYEVKTVTGWLRCDGCGSFYDSDGHRTYLDLELSKHARARGKTVDDLSEDEELGVFWECENW